MTRAQSADRRPLQPKSQGPRARDRDHCTGQETPGRRTMTGRSPAQQEPDDAEILSSGPETGADSATGVPACSKCRKPMMPRTKDGDWFWGCQDYPTCQPPTRRRPPVPPRLRKAAEALLASSTSDSSTAAGCSHPLTKPWGNGTGRGRKCLLCKAELGTGDDKPDNRRLKGQARGRRSSQKDRLNELEECLEQIG